jgi:hypothetical protein
VINGETYQVEYDLGTYATSNLKALDVDQGLEQLTDFLDGEGLQNHNSVKTLRRRRLPACSGGARRHERHLASDARPDRQARRRPTLHVCKCRNGYQHSALPMQDPSVQALLPMLDASLSARQLAQSLCSTPLRSTSRNAAGSVALSGRFMAEANYEVSLLFYEICVRLHRLHLVEHTPWVPPGGVPPSLTPHSQSISAHERRDRQSHGRRRTPQCQAGPSGPSGGSMPA